MRRLERLGAFAREGGDVKRVGVGQAHHRQSRLHAHTGNLDERLAEVELGLTRWLGERHEHFTVTVVVVGEVAPELTLRTLVAVLVAQALEDPLGGVALLLGGGLILLEDLVDHPEECSELGSRTLTRALLIASGLDVLEHLLQRVETDLIFPADLALGHLLHQYFSANVRPNLHVAVHPSPVLAIDLLKANSPARNCWVLLFSMRVLGTQCCYFRCAFTPERVILQIHDRLVIEYELFTYQRIAEFLGE